MTVTIILIFLIFIQLIVCTLSKTSLLIPVDPSSRYMTHDVDIGFSLSQTIPHYYQVVITDDDGKKIDQEVLNDIAQRYGNSYILPG